MISIWQWSFTCLIGFHNDVHYLNSLIYNYYYILSSWHSWWSWTTYSMYCTRENFGMGKIGKFGESWASYMPKFSLPIVTDTPEMYLGLSLFSNFSFPIAFTCIIRQNFLSSKISCVQYYNVIIWLTIFIQIETGLI